MRLPYSWLTELADLPDGTTPASLARRLTDAGLQVERVEHPAAAIAGPVVIGQILGFGEEPQKNGKTIRWCQVDVGAWNPDGQAGRGIVCGASNFAVGDFVVVALAGAVLPGGFAIAARKTYGHISDGMICAEDELGLGCDHAGIIVLPVEPRPTPGDDALTWLGAREVVYEIDVTPDEGYCLSIRGLAREAAQISGGHFVDPYAAMAPAAGAGQEGYPVVLASSDCRRFVAWRVDGIDPTRPTPAWMSRRLRQAGMRSLTLAVDISNYVMLESGQPLHFYDATSLRGPIVVRQADAGERITTLDRQCRTLSGDDLLITDDSGPIGLAGVMGGLTTELTPTTSDILIEAAWFNPATIGRTYRRHHLPSEASRRFERGVDMAVGYAAARRCAELLRDLAGGVIAPGLTQAGAVEAMPEQVMAAGLPAAILGAAVSPDEVVAILRASGVRVSAPDGLDRALTDHTELRLGPPTWRRDLVDPYDYVEEVGRKLGFAQVGSRLPTPPSGRGYTWEQRSRRRVLQAVAGAGFVEVVTLPFVGAGELDHLGLPQDDDRRRVVALANPLSGEQPYLRTSLLPGLLAAVQRNTSRSLSDLALFECGLVFRANQLGRSIMPAVSHRPSPAEIEAVMTTLPNQPRHLAGVVAGNWLPGRWDRPVEPADWRHVVYLAETAIRAVGLTPSRRAAQGSPWHPGRCADIGVDRDGVVHWLGQAGELHPDVVAAWDLPAGTSAVEMDVDALIELAPRGGQIRPLSTYPATKQDVALIVASQVEAGVVEAALRRGAGDLLESIGLFDVFSGAQVGAGKKSLAYNLVFRAPDRTLTEAEASAARDAAVAEAAAQTGAVMRAA